MTPLVQPRVNQIPQEMNPDVFPGFSVTSVNLSLSECAEGDAAAATRCTAKLLRSIHKL